MAELVLRPVSWLPRPLLGAPRLRRRRPPLPRPTAGRPKHLRPRAAEPQPPDAAAAACCQLGCRNPPCRRSETPVARTAPPPLVAHSVQGAVGDFFANGQRRQGACVFLGGPLGLAACTGLEGWKGNRLIWRSCRLSFLLEK